MQTWRSRLRTAALVAPAVAAACLLPPAAEAGAALSATAFIPPTAIMTVSFDRRALRAAPLLAASVDLTSLTNELEAAGIPAASVDDIVIAGESLTDKRRALTIVTGSFSREVALRGLESKGWRSPDPSAPLLLHNPTSDDWATVRGDGLVAVAGYREQIERLKSTGDGTGTGVPANPRLDPLREMISGPRPPVLMTVVFPAEVQSAASAAVTVSAFALDLAGFGALGDIMKMVSGAEAIVVRFRIEGKTPLADLGVVSTSESGPKLIAGSITLMGMMLGAVPAEQMTPEQRRELEQYSLMRATVQGKTLLVTLPLPPPAPAAPAAPPARKGPGPRR
jgi:hypothetical protein